MSSVLRGSAGSGPATSACFAAIRTVDLSVLDT
jgi:hypothetical protein